MHDGPIGRRSKRRQQRTSPIVARDDKKRRREGERRRGELRRRRAKRYSLGFQPRRWASFAPCLSASVAQRRQNRARALCNRAYRTGLGFRASTYSLFYRLPARSLVRASLARITLLLPDRLCPTAPPSQPVHLVDVTLAARPKVPVSHSLSGRVRRDSVHARWGASSTAVGSLSPPRLFGGWSQPRVPPRQSRTRQLSLARAP